MDDTRGKETERLREAVDNVRASVHETVDELSDRVNRAADVREQVRAHPIAALAVATVAGLVIGRQLTSLLGVGGLAALGIGREIGSIIGGYVIVGAVGAVLGAVVVGIARSRLAKQSLIPTQTIDEIQRDVTWMTRAGRKRSG